MSAPIIFNKPIRTREGGEVKLLSTCRGDDDFPIWAEITMANGVKTQGTFTSTGRYYKHGPETPYDLINVLPPMKVVYIAGPFRGPNSWEVEENIRRAERLALEAWRAGFAVICPHANTRFFNGAANDSVWLEGDLEILRRCDAVILTYDWERSSGAKKEKQFAEELKIPVFYSVADAVKHFSSFIV